MDAAEIKRRQLRWKCRRGMLELDIILLGYFEKHYDELNDQDKQRFERLLEIDDTLLFAWFMESEQPEDESLKAMVMKIESISEG